MTAGDWTNETRGRCKSTYPKQSNKLVGTVLVLAAPTVLANRGRRDLLSFAGSSLGVNLVKKTQDPLLQYSTYEKPPAVSNIAKATPQLKDVRSRQNHLSEGPKERRAVIGARVLVVSKRV